MTSSWRYLYTYIEFKILFSKHIQGSSTKISNLLKCSDNWNIFWWLTNHASATVKPSGKLGLSICSIYDHASTLFTSLICYWSISIIHSITSVTFRINVYRNLLQYIRYFTWRVLTDFSPLFWLVNVFTFLRTRVLLIHINWLNQILVRLMHNAWALIISQLSWYMQYCAS